VLAETLTHVHTLITAEPERISYGKVAFVGWTW
jgi:hypothetical protein